MSVAITAALVGELRERTGAGMMDCKKALVEAKGDIEAAIKAMREADQVRAVKKAGRIAAEGIILVRQSADKKSAVLLEINSETDFVARDQSFLAFANEVADVALAHKTQDVSQLSQVVLSSGKTVEAARSELVAKIGENISIRRVIYVQSQAALATYVHGVRIGVIVQFEGAEEIGRDIAMHIAASRPEVLHASDVDAARLAAERDIFIAQSRDSGKPENVIEKMIEGRLKKFINEVSLLGQPFVKQPDLSVEQFLKQQKATVLGFHRFEVGEGIEKKQENFRDEVMAQVRRS